MSCASPQRDHSFLKALTCRITWLECALKAWKVVLGMSTRRATRFADLYFTDQVDEGEGNVSYTLQFASEDGGAYQIQESPDGSAWRIAAPRVGATSTLTTWYSAWYRDTETVYFRVVTFPRSVICCEIPDDSEPVRFTEVLVGPTGGNVYGGCSDCAGNFQVCDDPLANLS